MLAEESPEIVYKEVRELLVQPKGIKLMDEGNKLTICAFVDKFTSKIYGIRKINLWLSKKKGCTFFDLMTISYIAYTVLFWRTIMRFGTESIRRQGCPL